MALGLVLALAGCGGSDHKGRSATTVATTAAAGAGPATTAGADGALPEIAARDTSDGKAKLRVAINQLHRDGTLLFLNLSLTNKGGDDNYQIADFLDDGDTNGLSGGDSGLVLDSVDGIYVTDQVHKKKYPAARDTEHKCLCSADLGNTFVGADQTVGLSTTFGAPPEDVKTVDVFVPHAGTFTGVPIS